MKPYQLSGGCSAPSEPAWVGKLLVLVDLIQENYTCICARFQKDGILCVHVLRTLIQLNKHTIPGKYFIDRWRPVEKKQVRNITTMVPAELQGGSSTLRYNLLSNKFIGVASDACLSLERTNYMIGELDRILSFLCLQDLKSKK